MWFFEAVWTGQTVVWGYNEKVEPFTVTRIPWEYYGKRDGMVQQMLPLPAFLDAVKDDDRIPRFVNNALRFANREVDGTRDPERKARLQDIIDSLSNASTEEARTWLLGRVEKGDSTPTTVSGLFDKTNAELREMCEERGLPVYGAKDVLVERLEAS